MKSILAAITLVFCSEAALKAENSLHEVAEAPEKFVAGMQAFLSPEQEAKLVGIWRRAIEIPGVKCALSDGAIPHMTTGSWKVSGPELALLKEKLRSAARGIQPFESRVSLVEEIRKDQISWFLRPESTQDLLGTHARLHKLLDVPFQQFREMDLPGQWEPHITLFSAPAAQRAALRSILEELAAIKTVRFERIGVVWYKHYPFRVEYEFPFGAGNETVPLP